MRRCWRRGGLPLLVTDIDGTLILALPSPEPGLNELREVLARRRGSFLFAVATGRSLTQARRVLDAYAVPEPDAIVSGVGTRIDYPPFVEPDPEWTARLRPGWSPRRARALGAGLPGLRLQAREEQSALKVSYDVDSARFSREALHEAARGARSWLNAVLSRDAHLDLLPRRASKGQAIRRVCARLGVPLTRALSCGDSGNDRDMLTTTGRAVVVGGHTHRAHRAARPPGDLLQRSTRGGGDPRRAPAPSLPRIAACHDARRVGAPTEIPSPTGIVALMLAARSTLAQLGAISLPVVTSYDCAILAGCPEATLPRRLRILSRASHLATLLAPTHDQSIGALIVLVNRSPRPTQRVPPDDCRGAMAIFRRHGEEEIIAAPLDRRRSSPHFGRPRSPPQRLHV